MCTCTETVYIDYVVGSGQADMLENALSSSDINLDDFAGLNVSHIKHCGNMSKM